jgi:hypothetical protein
VRLTQRLSVTLRILLVDAPHLGGSATSTRLPGQRQGSRASQDTFFKDDPSIREEVLDSRLGDPCHVSFCFFSPDFSGFSCQDFRWTLSQSPRLNLRLGAYSIWSAILQSHPHIGSSFKTRRTFFEDLRRQYSRTLGTTREDFKIAQTSAGVHSSLGML